MKLARLPLPYSFRGKAICLCWPQSTLRYYRSCSRSTGLHCRGYVIDIENFSYILYSLKGLQQTTKEKKHLSDFKYPSCTSKNILLSGYIGPGSTFAIEADLTYTLSYSLFLPYRLLGFVRDHPIIHLPSSKPIKPGFWQKLGPKSAVACGQIRGYRVRFYRKSGIIHFL